MERKAIVQGWYHGRVIESLEFETIESDKVSGRGCRIPVGMYKLTPYDSPKFKRVVPLLVDVPKRSYIEIHAAGKPTDVCGCIGAHRTTEARVTAMLLDKRFEKVTVTVYENENENENGQEHA